jgi:hypothetical protein
MEGKEKKIACSGSSLMVAFLGNINNETKNNGRRDKRQHTEIQGR